MLDGLDSHCGFANGRVRATRSTAASSLKSSSV
jgi:hypothetical protein